jgi:hypothetical protein
MPWAGETSEARSEPFDVAMAVLKEVTSSCVRGSLQKERVSVGRTVCVGAGMAVNVAERIRVAVGRAVGVDAWFAERLQALSTRQVNRIRMFFFTMGSFIK